MGWWRTSWREPATLASLMIKSLLSCRLAVGHIRVISASFYFLKFPNWKERLLLVGTKYCLPSNNYFSALVGVQSLPVCAMKRMPHILPEVEAVEGGDEESVVLKRRAWRKRAVCSWPWQVTRARRVRSSYRQHYWESYRHEEYTSKLQEDGKDSGWQKCFCFGQVLIFINYTLL